MDRPCAGRLGPDRVREGAVRRRRRARTSARRSSSYVVPSDGDVEQTVRRRRASSSARSRGSRTRPPSARSCRSRRTRSIRTAAWRRTSASPRPARGRCTRSRTGTARVVVASAAALLPRVSAPDRLLARVDRAADRAGHRADRSRRAAGRRRLHARGSGRRARRVRRPRRHRRHLPGRRSRSRSASSSSATRSNRCAPTIRRRSGRSRRSISSRSCRCASARLQDDRGATIFDYLAVRASRQRHRLPKRDEVARAARSSCSSSLAARATRTRVARQGTRRRRRRPISFADLDLASDRALVGRDASRRARRSTTTRAALRPTPGPRRRSARRVTSAASRPSSSTAASPTGSPTSAGARATARRRCSSPARAGRAERTVELLQEYDVFARPGRARRRRARTPRCSSPIGAAVARLPAARRRRCRSTPKPTSSRRSAARPSGGASATKAFLSDLRDLKVGDLVVHVDHGIGAVRRPEADRRRRRRRVQEFLELRYHGDDKLFVPVERLDLVQKYTGGDAARRSIGSAARPGRRPRRRSRRPCATWPRSCSSSTPRARRCPATPSAADTHWQEEFEDAFAYELTPDQSHGDRRHQARHGIADADGSAAVRRRRLRQDRSGDARRVQGGDGRQAGRRSSRRRRCWRSSTRRRCSERFAGFPGHASTWSAASARKQETEGDRSTSLAAGKVDIIVGTHRLLSKDVAVPATSACSSSTRSSASASRTRSASSRCARRSTC